MVLAYQGPAHSSGSEPAAGRTRACGLAYRRHGDGDAKSLSIYQNEEAAATGFFF